MEFLNLPLLAGALAGVLPVVIHMIHRERPRVVRFTALDFIQQSFERSRRAWKLKHLLLLLLRVTLVVLFAVILARPAWQKGGGVPGQTGTVRAAIILDDSCLMGFLGEDGRTDFDVAKEKARELINSLGKGSAVALLPCSQGPLDFTIDLSSVLRALELAPLSAQLESCTERIRAAAELFRRQADGQLELYVFSNFYRGTWNDALPASDSGQRKFRLALIDVSRSKAPNLSLVRAEVLELPVYPDTRVPIECEVFNDGPAKECSLELIVDGKVRGLKRARVPAESSALVRFDYVFPQAGLSQGVVRLREKDSMPADNARYFTADIHSPLQVALVVRSDGWKDVFFLRHALTPAGIRGRGRIVETLLESGELPRFDLSRTDAVWLVNLPRLEGKSWRRLLKYIEKGGGVAIVAGEAMDLDHYRNLPFLSLSIDGYASEQKVHLSSASRANPLVGGLFPNNLNALSLPTFYRYLRVSPKEEGEAAVLATFDGRDPALLEWKKGRGRLVFFTSSLKTDWSDFPKWPIFPPFAHELLQYLAGTRRPAVKVHPGEMFAVPLDENEVDAVVRIFEPGNERPVTLVRKPGTRRTLHQASNSLGNAQVFITYGEHERKFGYSSNLAIRPESFQRLSRKEIEAMVPGAVLVKASRKHAENVADASRGFELSPYLVAGLLILVCAECFLGNRIYR